MLIDGLGAVRSQTTNLEGRRSIFQLMQVLTKGRKDAAGNMSSCSCASPISHQAGVDAPKLFLLVAEHGPQMPDGWEVGKGGSDGY